MILSDDAELIAHCLTRMGAAPTFIDYETLTTGVSGSYTYKLQFATGTAILKVTLARSEPYIWQRAQREFAFYQTLAASIPLRIPRLLSSYADQDFGVCLLFAVYQLPSPTITWPESDYDEVAGQLARLHAQFWRKSDALAAHTWLRQPSLETNEDEIEQALTTWRGLRDQQRLRHVLTAAAYEAVCHKLAHMATVDRIIRSFSMTLCHGDCHLDNLLRDGDGNLVWADWQEVGLGAGPEDLSFFFQRALAMGRDIPVERMTAVYQERLRSLTGKEILLAQVKQIVHTSELRTSLLYWPSYLQQASAEQIANLLNRIELLADRIF
jgi:thiamine kinase-like enzyme